MRLFVLQNLYDLSDEGIVAEAIDSWAFSDSCGINSSSELPDGDTIGRFRTYYGDSGYLGAEKRKDAV